MGMSEHIHLERGDFFKLDPPQASGVIITNPPYGHRLEQDDILAFYKEIGNTFKQKYQGWAAWVLSGDKDAIKNLGLRTSKKLTLYNGSLMCKYHKYEMYQGSKKDK